MLKNAGAPTEYNFDNAVPPGHTAEIQPDGSVIFYDTNGTEDGGIAAPWAYDANQQPVPTSYTLNGTTLVQTVHHHDHAYPILVDPFWENLLNTTLVVVSIGTAVAACAGSVGLGCIVAGGVAIGSVVNYAVQEPKSPNSPARIPSHCQESPHHCNR